MTTKKGFTTTILHSDRLDKPEHGALHKPIHTSVTYGYDDVQDLVDIFQNKKKGYAYSRQDNPTTTALETKITSQWKMAWPPLHFLPGWPPSQLNHTGAF